MTGTSSPCESEAIHLALGATLHSQGMVPDQASDIHLLLQMSVVSALAIEAVLIRASDLQWIVLPLLM